MPDITAPLSTPANEYASSGQLPERIRHIDELCKEREAAWKEAVVAKQAAMNALGLHKSTFKAQDVSSNYGSIFVHQVNVDYGTGHRSGS